LLGAGCLLLLRAAVGVDRGHLLVHVPLGLLTNTLVRVGIDDAGAITRIDLDAPNESSDMLRLIAAARCMLSRVRCDA
jgi:hypothetical protein